MSTQVKKIDLIEKRLRNLWASLEGRGEAEIPASSILEIIGSISNIISYENDYLRAQEYDKATSLFESKLEAINIMTSLASRVRDCGVKGDYNEKESIRMAERTFHELLLENKMLLKDAMDIQGEVTKILVEGAVEVSQHGYDRSGQASFDSTKTNLSLDSQA